MNAILLQDALNDSPESWGSFTLVHGIEHDALDAALRKAGHEVEFYPLFDFPAKDNQDYLMLHAQVHESHGSALGIQLGTDLSTADFSDPDVVADWLQAHASIHLQENRALGLV